MDVTIIVIISYISAILFAIICFIVGYGCYRWYTAAEEKREDKKRARITEERAEERRLSKLQTQLEIKYDFDRVKEGVFIGYCIFLFGQNYYKTKTPDFYTFQWDICDTSIIIKTNKNLEVIDKRILER